MNASKEYMVNRYGVERYRAIEELNEIIKEANGKDFTKYFIAKRVRAWIVPIGTKCYAPHAVFESPRLFVEQLLLKFQKECRGNILNFKIKRKSHSVTYALDNLFFAKVDKDDTVNTRNVSSASISASSD